MTAPTLDRPRSSSPVDPAPRPPTTAAGSPAAGPMLVVAEVTLVAVTIAAALGLARLFVDGSFLLPVIAFAVVGHAVAAACRRTGLSAGATIATSIGTMVVALTWTLLPETTAFGIPTPGTLQTAVAELSSALATFREVVAPAPVEPGFVLAAAIGIWIVAFTADTAAFRAAAPLEAIVPSTTLFVFAAALGAPQRRLPITVVFLLALLAHWMAHRALAQATSPTWMATEGGSGPGSLLRAGATLAVVAVAAAIIVGPRIPGAGDSGVVPWRASEREGPGSLVVVSPLVDIQARIVDQADVEVFTVESEADSYWRLTSLETFNGRTWSSKGQYRPASGRLEGAGGAPGGGKERVEQRFSISQLDVKWLPAAYEPVAIDLPSTRYDASSGSLLTEEDVATGLEYTVTSSLKTIEGAELQEVGELQPGELSDIYTDLPDGFSVGVQELAFDIAGDPALTPYEKALALQDHFRSGEFTYDLDIEKGHDANALEAFLFDTKRGYCEQFAGSYAALARSIGLPARVAVGFTPGERGADGRFQVRGLNGHAWPEVYFADYGWVPFEPTPNRGIPGAESYTGVAEAQATPENPTTPTSSPTTTTTLAEAPATGPTTVPSILAPDMVDDEPVEEGGRGFLATWLPRLLLLVVVVAGVPAAWAGLVALASNIRRSRRRAAATGAADRIRVAWTEAVEALSLAGCPRHPWETPAEYAERAADRGADRLLMRSLAEAVSAADFGSDPGEELAGRAAGHARRIERAVATSADRKTRLQWAIDPRPLLPGRSTRMDVRDATTPVSGLSPH